MRPWLRAKCHKIWHSQDYLFPFNSFRYTYIDLTSISWQAFHWHCPASYWCFLESIPLKLGLVLIHFLYYPLIYLFVAKLKPSTFSNVFTLLRFFFGKVRSIQHELISCRGTSTFFLLMANFWGSHYLKLEDEKSESFLEDTWLPFLLLRGGGIDKRSPYTNTVNHRLLFCHCQIMYTF